MSTTEAVRNLNGKPAVYGGTAGDKIIAIVETELRFLIREEWERLPIWSDPESRTRSSDRRAP